MARKICSTENCKNPASKITGENPDCCSSCFEQAGYENEHYDGGHAEGELPDLKVPFNDIWLAFQLWAANQERDIDADDNRKVPLAHALTKAGSRADKGRPRGGGKTVAMRIGVALKGDEDGNPALAGI